MEDFLDSAESVGLQVTVRSKSLLKVIGNWCLVTSIFGFLLSGSGVLFFLFLLNDFNRGSYGLREDEIVGLGLVIFGILVVFFVSKFLVDYARNIKKSFALNSDIHFEKALKGLRNGLAFIGVIVGLGVLFFMFILIIALSFSIY